MRCKIMRSKTTNQNVPFLKHKYIVYIFTDSQTEAWLYIHSFK